VPDSRADTSPAALLPSATLTAAVTSILLASMPANSLNFSQSASVV